MSGTQVAGAGVDRRDRGSLHIADRVVEKIAATAVLETPGTLRVDPRLRERVPGRWAMPARVDALVSGRLVQLRLGIGVDYPQPVSVVTRAVREHVGATVARLCDVEVRDVDVDVVLLRRTQTRRRVQ